MLTVMELLETMQDFGIAQATNAKGEKAKIAINPQLVSEALRLPQQGYALGTWLTKKDKAATSKCILGQTLTYTDVQHPKVDPLLQLHKQHFKMASLKRVSLVTAHSLDLP